jgi:hypothetical protein
MIRSSFSRTCVHQVRAFSSRALTATPTPMYAPTLVATRDDEGGPGGRSSNADLKVAVFGANGFLGRHVAHFLGT